MSIIRWTSYRKLGILLCGFLLFQGILAAPSPPNKVKQHEDSPLLSNQDELKLSAPPGPHGYLIVPQGGKLIRSVGGLGIITVKFSKYVGDEGQTISIDLKLKPISDDENRAMYLLGNGLTSGKNNNIEVQFNSRWACGNYRWVLFFEIHSRSK